MNDLGLVRNFLPYYLGGGSSFCATVENDIFTDFCVYDIVGSMDESRWGMNIQVVPAPRDVPIVLRWGAAIEEVDATVVPTAI